MEYENPKIPEHINTSRENPLKEFSTLLIGAIVLVIITSFVLGFGGSWLAGKIPFSAEIKIASLYDISQHTDSKEHPELTEYLQKLVNKIGKAQNLPDDMPITAHYMDSPTVNAFATLGGNLFIFRGLLEKIEYENTLTTLLAHEVAHVKYRHPIKSMGRGITVGIAMATITGNSDANILGDAGLLTVLQFSREMEIQSDEEAMDTLNTLYGHLGGGADLFAMFHQMRAEMDAEEPLEIFSTHPLDEARIKNFAAIANKKGWEQSGKMTPLPAFFNKAFN